MTVGFIGLGNMGQGMVDNLLEKGADLTVFTRTQSKIEAMIDRGANGATSVAELARSVDVVLVCLPDIRTSRDLLLGENGVIANAKPGQIVVDHSTVDIATSRTCAEAAELKGVHFLDAPISGGPGGAAEGTLAIMVGGNEDAFETAYEYLGKMGANVKLMGHSGAGTAMKLINQLLVGINTVAAAEAFAWAASVPWAESGSVATACSLADGASPPAVASWAPPGSSVSVEGMPVAAVVSGTPVGPAPTGSSPGSRPFQ